MAKIAVNPYKAFKGHKTLSVEGQTNRILELSFLQLTFISMQYLSCSLRSMYKWRLILQSCPLAASAKKAWAWNEFFLLRQMSQWHYKSTQTVRHSLRTKSKQTQKWGHVKYSIHYGSTFFNLNHKDESEVCCYISVVTLRCYVKMTLF